jgi:5-hydroxyisourate hydrolase
MLYRVSGNTHRKIAEMVTNADGRTEGPILPQGAFATGMYELVFCAGEYLRRTGQGGAEPLFLDEVPIRFGMAEAAHYHVPLLLSPYGYSTYRGS